MGTYLKCLVETLLMSSHNIGIHEGIKLATLLAEKQVCYLELWLNSYENFKACNMYDPHFLCYSQHYRLLPQYQSFSIYDSEDLLCFQHLQCFLFCFVFAAWHFSQNMLFCCDSM